MDVRQPVGSLPISEGMQERVFAIPWFKQYRPRIIEEHAAAFRKAAEGCKELLAGDNGNPPGYGGWSLTFRR